MTTKYIVRQPFNDFASLPLVGEDNVIYQTLDNGLFYMYEDGAYKLVLGGGGTTYIESTFSDFNTARLGGTLVSGAMYLITDYQTIYMQPDYDAGGSPKTATIKTASVEPIVVTATSNNTIEPIAYSPSFPLDTIYYDPTVETLVGNITLDTMGKITRRIDDRGNDIPLDFRTVLFKRYESVDGSGVFDSYKDTGFASSEFLTFVNYSSGRIFNNKLNKLDDSIIYSPYTQFSIWALNIVFFGNILTDNTIGETSSRNTFFVESFKNNKIGTYCVGNLVETPQFENNIINSYFSENNIKVLFDFTDNHIFNTFQQNFVYSQLFSRNKITGGFSNNSLQSTSTFNDNEIKSGFSYNNINKPFGNNTLICGAGGSVFNTFPEFTSNTVFGGFNFNTGEGVIASSEFGVFDYNSIEGSIFSTKIVFNASGNTFISGSYLGSNVFHGDLLYNTFSGSFTYNQVGAKMESNLFDVGSTVQGNDIGMGFQNNMIAGLFNENILNVAYDDKFTGNSIMQGSALMGNTFQRGFINNTFNLNSSVAQNVFGLFQSNIVNGQMDFNLLEFSSNGNSFLATCYFNFNSFGSNFDSNVLDGTIEKNTIASNFESNILSSGSLFSKNDIATYFSTNTLQSGAYFTENIVGNDCNNNNVGGSFQGNTVGNKFTGNLLGGTVVENSFGVSFNNNTFTTSCSFTNNSFLSISTSNTFDGYITRNSFNYFSSNSILCTFTDNKINSANSNTFDATGGITYNQFGGYFDYNTITCTTFDNNVFHAVAQTNNFLSGDIDDNVFYQFSSNSITGVINQNNFNKIFNSNQFNGNFYNNITNFGQSNIFNGNCYYNIFGDNFIGNTILDFYNNETKNQVATLDFTLATHVQATYACTIQARQDGTLRLIYMDNTDAFVSDVPTD